MTTVIQYRVYCNTEAVYYETWNTSDPSVCPNNSAHGIDPDKTVELMDISEEAVKIKEETSAEGTTGGHFQASSIGFNATANSVTTADFSYPTAIGPLSIEYVTTDDHEGDLLTVQVAPQTIIGAITSNVEANSKVAFMSSTVHDNSFVGAFLELTDGVQLNDIGRIISMHSANGMVEFETATSNTFVYTSPTYVRQSIHMIHNLEFGPAHRHVHGESKIGASYIPANTTIRVKYTNNSANNDKRFVANIEKLY